MDLLIFGDTDRSPALRHEVPVGISDPFLYLEADGRRSVVTNALEDERISAAAPDIERLSDEELGKDELIAAGRSGLELDWEICLRAVQRLDITDAVVPPENLRAELIRRFALAAGKHREWPDKHNPVTPV